MTRYTLTFKRFACPSCGAENLVQPIKSINTLVEGLAMPSEDALRGVTACNKCAKEFATADAQFLGWVDENTPADPAVVEKYAVPAFLRK
jgi:transcription elongation factor Elf1